MLCVHNSRGFEQKYVLVNPPGPVLLHMLGKWIFRTWIISMWVFLWMYAEYLFCPAGFLCLQPSTRSASRAKRWKSSSPVFRTTQSTYNVTRPVCRHVHFCSSNINSLPLEGERDSPDRDAQYNHEHFVPLLLFLLVTCQNRTYIFITSGVILQYFFWFSLLIVKWLLGKLETLMKEIFLITIA